MELRACWGGSDGEPVPVVPNRERCAFLRPSFSCQSSPAFSAEVGIALGKRLVQSDLNTFVHKSKVRRNAVSPLAIGCDLISMQMHFLIFSREDVKMQLLSKMKSTALTDTSGLQKLCVVLGCEPH